MTVRDFIKLELITFGYDRNIRIEPTIGYGSYKPFEVYAENRYGDSFCNIGNICEIIRYIHLHIDDRKERLASGECGASAMPEFGSMKLRLLHLPLKTLLDDSERERVIAEEETMEKVIGEFQEEEKVILKDYHEWADASNPCSWDCPDNKHDYSGDGGMWFNCSCCATGSADTVCEKINAYRRKRDEWLAKLSPERKKAKERIKKKYGIL